MIGIDYYIAYSPNVDINSNLHFSLYNRVNRAATHRIQRSINLTMFNIFNPQTTYGLVHDYAKDRFYNLKQ